MKAVTHCCIEFLYSSSKTALKELMIYKVHLCVPLCVCACACVCACFSLDRSVRSGYD